MKIDALRGEYKLAAIKSLEELEEIECYKKIYNRKINEI